MNPIIEIKNVTKRFTGVTALDQVNMKVYEGDIYGILGPDGAGKSTIVKMLLSLLHPDDGTIYLDHYELNQETVKTITTVGATIERPCFYPHLSGYRNLCLSANLYGLPKIRVEEVLEMVNLSDSKHIKVSNYSLGMQQRLAIARAFLNHPKIVILDEPTNRLDAQGVIGIRNLIRELAYQYQVTFVICTHVLSEVLQLCNRVTVMNQGKVVVEKEVKKLWVDEYEEYVLGVDSIEETIKVLVKKSQVIDIAIRHQGLRIKISKGTLDSVSCTLARNSIEVYSIDKVEYNLNDFFAAHWERSNPIVGNQEDFMSRKRGS